MRKLKLREAKYNLLWNSEIVSHDVGPELRTGLTQPCPPGPSVVSYTRWSKDRLDWLQYREWGDRLEGNPHEGKGLNHKLNKDIVE